VGLCGERADEEPLGDLCVVVTLADFDEDIAFAVGEGVEAGLA